MPFKSDAQRRYLWANDPEIARDWTETYGSRIQKNNGGIMRVPFRTGHAAEGQYSGGSKTSGTSNKGGYTGSGGGGADASTQSFDLSATPNRPSGPIGSPDSGGPGPDRSAVGQFSQYGKNVMAQNLRGPTWSQQLGQGIGKVWSDVKSLAQQGGISGAILNALFGGPQSSRRELGIMNQLKGPGGSTLSIGRNNVPMSREGGDTPWWMQLGYPSYEAWLAAQNQGIMGIEGIDVDETEDDFIQRFRLADAYRQQPGTTDIPITYT